MILRSIRTTFWLFITAAVCLPLQAQIPVPKLIVVVSFDQFRGDYPERFERAYPTNGGFRRIMLGGTTFGRCLYGHANNITGPGHATLLTGHYPSRTGIVGNDFCDLSTNRCGYCAQDTAGVFGASKLAVPTLGDRLRERNPNSKVVGVALKDRAAILMAGRSATSCVWFDPTAKAWVSSPAYPKSRWLSSLNADISTSRFEGAVWQPLMPDGPTTPFDSVDGEGAFPGGTNAFPHRILPPDHPKFVASILISPFSMEMLFDATLEIIDRERLGQDAAPDLLCVGVSATDYVGHVFGPDSREVMDMYARADRHMGHLIDHLDSRVGRENYVVVVTSDHGVAPIPEVLQRQAEQQRATIDAGRIREAEIQRRIDSALTTSLGALSPGASYVKEIFEPSVYLNWDLISSSVRSRVIDQTVAAIDSHPGIGIAVASEQIIRGVRPEAINDSLWSFIVRSTYAGRTGDVVMYPKQYWIIGGNPATHGTPHEYDRWVPLMFYGGIISPQRIETACSPVDLAPTLATMLGIEMGQTEGVPLTLRLRVPPKEPKKASPKPQVKPSKQNVRTKPSR